MQARTQHPWFSKEVSILPIAFFLALQPANALTTKDIEGLTYSQIKGTGIANRCPEASSSGKEQEITLDSGTKYKLVDFCLEPKSFQVEQETEKRKGVFAKGKRCTGMQRFTST
jgi:photosystem II oxygen-evolving enhancer protein 1